MIAQLIRTQYDNKLLECEVDIVTVLKNPVTASKTALMQWQFLKLKEGAPSIRCQDNYSTRHALILDIDKNWTISAFEKEYSHLAFAIHTTSSHTPEINKFRVILPLDCEYPNELFRDTNVQHALREYFPGFDPSSLSNFHKLPVLPANPVDYYCNFNKGTRFSYSLIKARVDEIVMSEQLDRELDGAFCKSTLAGSGEVNKAAYKAKVDQTTNALVRGLPAHENGSRYQEFCSAMGTLLNNKYPDGEHIYDRYDIKTLLSQVYWDRSLDKALTSFARRRK